MGLTETHHLIQLLNIDVPTGVSLVGSSDLGVFKDDIAYQAPYKKNIRIENIFVSGTYTTIACFGSNLACFNFC